MFIAAFTLAPCANLPGQNEYGGSSSTSPLIQALVDDNATLALELLARGADPSAFDVITPLYAAQEYVANSRLRRRMLHALLAAGADPDQPTQDGSTTLMLAAYNGDVRSASLLIDAGADPRIVNEAGHDSVGAARFGRHRELGEEIRERALEAADAQRAAWSALVARVESHVSLVHSQLQTLYNAMCGANAGRVPSPTIEARANVNVPSCAGLRTAGLELYYGHLNILLAEAWLVKIVPALKSLEASAGKPQHEKPLAKLITIEDAALRASGSPLSSRVAAAGDAAGDAVGKNAAAAATTGTGSGSGSLLAGAIYVQQLWRVIVPPATDDAEAGDTTREEAATSTRAAETGALVAERSEQAPERELSHEALMIGIHRMPEHKGLRHLRGGRQLPSVNVTDALVSAVQAWCQSRHEIARLLVCPYDEIVGRLRALGFDPAEDPAAPLLFGEQDLRQELCEEAQLHAYDCTPLGREIKEKRDAMRRARRAEADQADAIRDEL